MVAGCNLSGLNDPIVVPFVDDEFYAELWENITPEGRQLHIRLSTIEPVECKNATIGYSYQSQGDEGLQLQINEILIPENCEEGAAPARAVVELGRFSEGTYPLRLSLRDAVDSEGRLFVLNDRYQITLEEGGGVVPMRPVLHRIPMNTLWGYIHIKGDESLEAAAETFLQDLQGLTASQSVKNGHYGYFEVDQGNIIWAEADDEEQATDFFPFVRSLPTDGSDVQSLLSDYRSTYGEDLEIKVWTTGGEEW